MKEKKTESSKFHYFRYYDTGKTEPAARTIKGKKQTYNKKVTEKVYFDPQTVFNFNLETVTPSVSVDDGGGFTQYHNYLWLWTPFIGGMEVFTYMAIRKYLFDYLDRHGQPEEFITFPSLEEICHRIGVKRAALNGYLDSLEKYGFLFRFWKSVDVFDKHGKPKGMRDAGVVYVVRKKIPILSDDLAEQLTVEDRKYHERIKALVAESSSLMISTEDDYKEEYQKHLKDLTDQGIFKVNNGSNRNVFTFVEDGTTVVKSKEDVIREITQNGLSEEDKLIWTKILNALRHKVSKPSFDTWLKGTLGRQLDSKEFVILAPNEFAKDWLQTSYIQMIRDTFKEELQIEANISIEVFDSQKDAR
ncbi:DnaA N-terminal domain-containing protein [Terribacillus sp. DMT04]|uniref:DnaA N-terminal domain-containing protein n=1 Tax=Terribacillus sp. DMT04 TaxID=2850441 RepID=UPI001C2B7F4B|nr:DnaA N-terminal domain-containing protein [Terribacillus sp. DMT04]QXE03557.1 hypothetical protein KS242_17945 [Terribacillus sp. DMT04]